MTPNDLVVGDRVDIRVDPFDYGTDHSYVIEGVVFLRMGKKVWHDRIIAVACVRGRDGKEIPLTQDYITITHYYGNILDDTMKALNEI